MLIGKKNTFASSCRTMTLILIDVCVWKKQPSGPSSIQMKGTPICIWPLVSVVMSHLLSALQHTTIDLFRSTVHFYWSFPNYDKYLLRKEVKLGQIRWRSLHSSPFNCRYICDNPEARSVKLVLFFGGGIVHFVLGFSCSCELCTIWTFSTGAYNWLLLGSKDW